MRVCLITLSWKRYFSKKRVKDAINDNEINQQRVEYFIKLKLLKKNFY